MSNIFNLQRDALWGPNPLAEQTLQDNSTLGGPKIPTAEPVYSDKSSAHILGDAMAAGTGYSFGVKLIQPTEETNPYRVKAYTSILSDDTTYLTFFYGYVQDGVATILEPIHFPIGNGMDEIIMIEPQTDPTIVDKALGFGIFCAADKVANLTAAISVQRLGVTPPQFGSSVS